MTTLASLSPLLVANRGEIAVRIIRACREAGLRSIAVYSDADAGALHTRLADQALRIGPAPARQSYLDIDAVLAAAREAGARAVHPGYGLLSENADFAAAVEAAGLVFIGPTPDAIAAMGDKVAARGAAADLGIPLLPGSDGAVDELDSARRIATDIGLPLVVKASFGGGGRGMRVVREAAELETALTASARESQLAFGRAEIYLERYVERARHVEVQVLGDGAGGARHLGDRDCSMQRRHQKLIEEAPAPHLPEALRSALHESALRLTAGLRYRGVGTVEFLVDAERGDYYFLEMNTRLQVEHGVTEMITGIDLVQAQLGIAAGQPLDTLIDGAQHTGHAIQARIAAEDPWLGFAPAPGRIGRMSLPLGPWLRVDFGVEAGDEIPPHYDSMFGKLQAWGADRESARRRLIGALDALRIEGLPTTAPYLAQLLAEDDFIAVRHDTGSLERQWAPDPARRPPIPETPHAPLEPEDAMPATSQRRIRLDTRDGPLDVLVHGRLHRPRDEQAAEPRSEQVGPSTAGAPVAPIDGTVVAVHVIQGQTVSAGDVLVVLEAMKMEMPVCAGRDAVIDAVLVTAGDAAARGQTLVRLRDDGTDTSSTTTQDSPA